MRIEELDYDKSAAAISKTLEEIGLSEIEDNVGTQVGYSRLHMTTINGARQSNNGAFIRPIRGRRKNLTIRYCHFPIVISISELI